MKSLEQCLHNLIRSAGGDGNLLFNVGPKPDGTIEPLQVERLREMGVWLKKYGDAIYGTRGGPFKPADWGVSTRKGNKVYLHILKWSGASPKILVPDIGIKIKSAGNETVGRKKPVRTGEYYVIEFNAKYLQPINTIIEIEYESDVMNVTPIETPSQSVSFMKPVIGSSNQKAQWIDHQWVDLKAVNNGDWSGSFWQPADNDKTPWLEFDLGKPAMVSKAILYESGNNVKSYELQVKSGDGWKTVYEGTTIGPRSEVSFKPVESQLIRLQVNSFTGTLQIYEIMLLK